MPGTAGGGAASIGSIHAADATPVQAPARAAVRPLIATTRSAPAPFPSAPESRSAPLMVIDSLTGLFNESFIRGLVSQEIGRALRYGRYLSLIAARIDDSAGIRADLDEAGWRVLVGGVGRVLAAAVRDSDTVASVGSEAEITFVITLPETDRFGAVRCAERIRQRVAETVLFGTGMWTHATISCGVSTLRAADLEPQDLIWESMATLVAGAAAGGGNRTHTD